MFYRKRSGRGRPARLQCEFLPGAVEPNDKVTEEIAPKKYFGALVTDDRQFDLMPGRRNRTAKLGEEYPQITQITQIPGQLLEGVPILVEIQ